MKNFFRNAIAVASTTVLVTAAGYAQQAPAAPAAPAAQAAAAGQATAAAATAVAAQADPFTVTLPQGFTPFVKQSQTVKTPDGKDETITNWVSKAPTGEAVVVTVSKMPGKILDPNAMITTTRDSVIKSLNAQIESDDKLPGTMPAEQVVFHSGTAAFLRAQLAVQDDSLYQLLYVGRSAEQRAVPAVEQLFGSFKINAPAATVAAAQPAQPVPAASSTH